MNAKCWPTSGVSTRSADPHEERLIRRGNAITHYLEESETGDYCLHVDASKAIDELAGVLRELLDFSDIPPGKHNERCTEARRRAAELLERMGK